MKHRLTFLFLLVASFGMASAEILERVYINGLYYNLDTNSKTAEVTNNRTNITYTSYPNLVSAIIPESVNYASNVYSVTSIGVYAFSECKSLESVAIPNSVTTIGYGAFFSCSQLSSINLPNSVVNIEDNVFNYCDNLNQVVNNTHIFAHLPISFTGAYNIPDSIESIVGGAFYNCRKLVSVTIPNSVTDIGKSAFAFCNDLTSVVIPNSITSIKGSTFHECTHLTSIVIPNSVTSIGVGAFAGCRRLTSVTIPNSVTSIGAGAFRYTGLTTPVYNAHIFAYLPTTYAGTYTIPTGIESIAGNAFHECESLISVVIPNSITSIGEEAFADCSSLKSITIPSSVTTIGENAFYNVYNIVYAGTATGSPWGALNVGKYVDEWCVYEDETKTYLIECYNNDIEEFTIPESVMHIADSAFFNLSNLKRITIPNSVITIGNNAFANCLSLKYVSIGEGLQDLGGVYTTVFENCENIDTVIWNAIACQDMEYSPFYYSRENIKDFVISDNIQRIPANLCWGIKAVHTLSIPSSVYIGKDAFYGTNISEVNIPNTVQYVGGRAFANCPLTKVHWDVADQENYEVLDDIDGRITVSLDASNLDWDHVYLYAWNSNGAILSAWPGTAVPKDENGRYTYSFSSTYTSVNIIWNNGTDQTVDITSVKESAIYTLNSSSGTNITYTTRPLDGRLICPFYRSTDNITQFTFGKNVARVPAQLCRDMKKITNIEIPLNTTEIGRAAFKGCSKLESLVLNENVTSYGAEVFAGCSSLASIYNYRERPVKLGENAFDGVDYFNCTLYVLAGSVDMYKASASDWKDFYFVEAIGATNSSTNEVIVTPDETTAEIVWPSVNGAATYELVIKDKKGNVVCTLIFNENGQLTRIAFGAPSREQSAGFSFTVTGLEEGKSYNLTITAKDNNGAILDEQSVSFRTNGEGAEEEEGEGEEQEGLDQITNDQPITNKVIKDGQILILRGDKTYTLQGQEAR